MFRPFLPVLGAVVLLVIGAGHAIAKTAPAQNTPANHVWTNQDIDRLRAEGLISEFTLGPVEEKEITSPVNGASASSQEAGVDGALASRPPKLQDSEWYAEEAAELHARLEEDEAAVQLAETNLALAREGRTEPGLNMFEGEPGITPESGIANLQLRVRDDEALLDQLSDLARQNGVEPGTLRS